MRAGPLAGVRVIEIAGIGPGPFAAMLLADLGADVLRVDRKDGAAIARAMGMDFAKDISNRGRPSVALDLKHPEAVAVLLDLLKPADVLIEGFRPGVMEGLGLGPEVCLARNPKLVYGRMTGWGQTGPLARRAGHDINYIAMSGVLHTFARQNERPVPPGNTVGDMGGGGLMLAFGVVSALLEARGSGRGQVVDAAMFEGAALLGTSVFVMMAMGLYDASRPGTNLGDTGAHFYEVYETSDARYVAVGAIEPQFYSQLLKGLGLDAALAPEANGCPDLAGHEASLCRHFSYEDTGGVGTGLRGHGCLCIAGPVPGRGRRRPSCAQPREFCRRGRRIAAGSGAALQSHARGSLPPAAHARCGHG